MFRCLILIMFLIGQVFAQDYDLGEVKVYSSKMDDRWLEHSSSVKTLSDKMIDANIETTRTLREAGVEVVESGVNGASTIFLRGLSGRHTIVMIDGIPINDISNPSGEFNGNYLRNIGIERIEIYKGTQSVLHSGALGGVINIITKNIVGHSEVYGGLETYQSSNIGLSLSGLKSKVLYFFNTDYIQRGGFSEVSFGDEKDLYLNRSYRTQFKYELGERGSGSTSVQYHETFQEFDQAGNPPVDSLVNFSTNKTLLASQSFRFKIHPHWESELDLSHLKTSREYFGSWRSSWMGQQARVENRYRYHFDMGKILVGYTYISDSVDGMNLDERINQFDLFYKFSFKFAQAYKFEQGIRRINHESYGSKNLYQASISHYLDGYILSLNWGTSFRSPSIAELYTPSTGNQNLYPESSYSWELNFKKSLELAHWQLSLFSQKVKNYIIFDTQLKNSGELATKGVELEYGHEGKMIDHFLNTSYHDPSNENGGRALRRAYWKMSWKGLYHINAKQDFKMLVRYVGERLDTFDRLLEDYVLWDLGYRHKFKKSEFSLRVDNILNKEYFEIYGYQTLKRNVRIDYAYQF